MPSHQYELDDGHGASHLIRTSSNERQPGHRRVDTGVTTWRGCSTKSFNQDISGWSVERSRICQMFHLGLRPGPRLVRDASRHNVQGRVRRHPRRVRSATSWTTPRQNARQSEPGRTAPPPRRRRPPSGDGHVVVVCGATTIPGDSWYDDVLINVVLQRGHRRALRTGLQHDGHMSRTLVRGRRAPLLETIPMRTRGR